MLHLFAFNTIKNKLFWTFLWLFVLTWFVVLPGFVYAQDDIISGNIINSESENTGIIQSYWSWQDPEPNSCQICGGNTPNSWFWYKYRNDLQDFLIYLLIVIIVSFFVTLWFYLIYKHKNDEHPRKYAIKRSWPRWIIIFLTPFILRIEYLII